MRFLKLLIQILRAAFWVTLLFALDRPYLAILTLLAIVFHEGCHFLALLRIRHVGRFRARLGGISLHPNGVLSYREERRIAAAGPLGGLLAAFVCFFLSPFAPGYLSDFAYCHLLTSLSNLLPIEGYDGYRILAATAQMHGFRGLFALRMLSLLLTATLSFLSLSLFGILGEGFWPAGAFLFTLIYSLPEEKNAFFEDS